MQLTRVGVLGLRMRICVLIQTSVSHFADVLFLMVYFDNLYLLGRV
jgi:hypothetical protein